MPVQPRPHPENRAPGTEPGVDYAAVQCPPEPKLTFRAPAEARTGYDRPPPAPTPPCRSRAPWVPQERGAPRACCPRAPEPEATPEPVQERLPERSRPPQERNRCSPASASPYARHRRGAGALHPRAAGRQPAGNRQARRTRAHDIRPPAPPGGGGDEPDLPGAGARYTPDRAAARRFSGGAAAHKLAGLWPGTLRERAPSCCAPRPAA